MMPCHHRARCARQRTPCCTTTDTMVDANDTKKRRQSRGASKPNQPHVRAKVFSFRIREKVLHHHSHGITDTVVPLLHSSNQPHMELIKTTTLTFSGQDTAMYSHLRRREDNKQTRPRQSGGLLPGILAGRPGRVVLCRGGFDFSYIVLSISLYSAGDQYYITIEL